MTSFRSETLYFRDGKSDKVYSAQILGSDKGYEVLVQFGRRGSTLQSSKKTSSPTTIEKATALFEKVVSEKLGKGYTRGECGSPYSDTELSGTHSGIFPQLLTEIDSIRINELLQSPLYGLQEKHDGEDLDDHYVAFDLISLNGVDYQARPFRERYDALVSLLSRSLNASSNIRLADLVLDANGKHSALTRLRDGGAEGIVMRPLQATYQSGASTGLNAVFKFKFWSDATVIVDYHNVDKRSIRMALHDHQNSLITVGNVTIPPNKPVPPVGSLIDVRYLYAYRGGALFQPTFLRERNDLDSSAATITQLKFVKEAMCS